MPRPILAIERIASTADIASAQDKLDRTTLPIRAPTYKAITEVEQPDNKFTGTIAKVTVELK